jgi:hypothetical protein
MENLKKELQLAIMERFKQGKIASALEKELAEHTENITLEKYKGTKIKRDGLEYELFDVKANCYTNECYFKPENISTDLIYTITSELKKDEEAELKKAKDKFRDNKYMGWLDKKKFKRKLWIEESYDISIDEVIKNEINLGIDGKII